MALAIAFLYQDNIYQQVLEEGKKLTIGSGKKEDIQVPELLAEQVVVQWKKRGKGIFMMSKFPDLFKNQQISQDSITVINADKNMAVYISSYVDQSPEQVQLPYNCQVQIGRSSKSNIVIASPYVSGKHLKIRSEAGIIHVEDLGSTNGTYLNGKRITQAKLRSGDVLSLFTIQIRLINAVLYFENVGETLTVRDIPDDIASHDVSMSTGQGAPPVFRRSPRTQEQLPQEPITLANPPMKGQKFEKGRGMFASFLGTGAMFATSMAMGAASPAFMAARAAGLVTPIASMGMQSGSNKKRKKKLEEYERLRGERYGRYIQEQKARIDAVANDQKGILTRENPAPKDCVQIVKNVKRSLWERATWDRDFLDVRLGMGYEDLCVPVRSFAGENSFQMEDDEIREMAEAIIDETRIVDFVPARLKMGKYNTIGMIGDRRKVLTEVRNMIVSLTSAHYYSDVKIVGIFDESERHEWESLRWLPHIWDDNMQTRYLAFGRKEAHHLCEIMNEMLDIRKRELPENTYGNVPQPKPHYIFILGSKQYLQDELLMQNLILNKEGMGATALFLFDEMYSLPHECQFIVDMDQGPAAYEKAKMNQKFIFTMDEKISFDELDSYARTMSAIHVEGFAMKSEVPDSVTFLQGYGTKTVRGLQVKERWNSNKAYESMAAPIGVLAGGKTFSLDIGEKAHGPHGLVAGTTGSGKSELLQTWILSMAVNFHPYDVVFVLIDYKGGGMANLLEGLPHVVGKITNIGSNINRSLISLQSEIKRRLRVFEQCGNECGTPINNIDKYQKLYREGKIREPLPHLIIVADEFAELKKEEPEFMAGLVSASRVGRSLGIHLVLATQKPSGVVNDQIWSNSRFKLCLKVQDTADSREMLKKPDAASITRAGRCYVQVGMDEVYELFQSYWSGASYFDDGRGEQDISNRVRVVVTDGMRLKTAVQEKTRFKSDVDELAAVVKYLGMQACEMGIRKLDGPWLPELPEYLPLEQMERTVGFLEHGWNSHPRWLRIPIGKFDSPETQSQGIQYIDLQENGHLGIYGAPSTGKTTLLKTIILSAGLNYSPDDVQMYVMDCGGWSTSVFSGMPHMGGIALDCEQEKMEKLEKLIWEELEARKRVFLQHRVSSLLDYRESISEDMPAIILAIDNLPSLLELYPDMENMLVTVSREGATYGIYMIYTANSQGSVRFKIQQNIKSAIAFELTDKGDYPALVGRLDGQVLPHVTGRAFIKGAPPLMFQAAVYMDAENERKRSEKVQGLLAKMNAGWTGKRPRSIPVMPQIVGLEDMKNEWMVREQIPLGIYYDDISTCRVNLEDEYGMLLSGTIGCGKSAYLLGMSKLIYERHPEAKIYVFDGLKKSMSTAGGYAHAYGACDDVAATHQMLEEIVEQLNVRKRSQNQAKATDPEHFDEKEYIQKFEQIYLLVDDLKEFVDTVEEGDQRSLERICRLAGQLGVVVIAAGRAADLAKYSEIEALTRVLAGNQKGLVLGGSASLYTFFPNDMKYTEKTVELKEGEAYFFNNGSCRKVKPMGILQ